MFASRMVPLARAASTRTYATKDIISDVALKSLKKIKDAAPKDARAKKIIEKVAERTK